jgi:hypothetical protein
LASVVVTSVVNAAVNVPTFTAGTANAVVVTATKIDPSQPSSLAMRVTNTAGGVTDCDPPF